MDWIVRQEMRQSVVLRQNDRKMVLKQPKVHRNVPDSTDSPGPPAKPRLSDQSVEEQKKLIRELKNQLAELEARRKEREGTFNASDPCNHFLRLSISYKDDFPN